MAGIRSQRRASDRRNAQSSPQSYGYTLILLAAFVVSASNIFTATRVNRADGGGDTNEPGKYRTIVRSPADEEEAVVCSDLLGRYRRGEFKPPMANETLFREPLFTLASAMIDEKKRFYISVHHGEIDHTRVNIMKHKTYYEMDLSKIIAQTFEEKRTQGADAIFLDVGANIGWFSLVAAAHGASRVYAFEPNEGNTVRFCESLSLNGMLDGSVVPIAKGVGNVEGEQDMYIEGHNNPGKYSFQKKGRGRVVGKMKLTTLDSFAEKRGWFRRRPDIAFMKLDVESFELQALQGADRLLRSRIIQMIAMELKKSQSKETISEIVRRLFEAGYRPTHHGGFKGPNTKIGKKYADWKEIVDDLKSLGENLLFSLEDS